MSSDALQIELVKSETERKARSIKVVVWDLDNTLWDGVLLEDKSVALFPGIVALLEELDRRGILQSIASKNDYDTALAKLTELGIAEYFIYPQINWSAKSRAVEAIAADINVGIETLAFIDDQSFEREEVNYVLPGVLCIDAAEAQAILDRAEFMPRFITDDASNRRLMYLGDIKRNTVEREFQGPKEEFLATLGLEFTLARATERDLQRAEELTLRTHQLNTTGYTYSYDELEEFMNSERHDLLIGSLTDKFGTYGKIGLCLIERSKEYWTLKLLLMSCRVMSRGVGSIMINYVIAQAKEAGVRLRAEMIRTDRNRMMFMTYRLGNFQILSESGDSFLLENDCSVPPQCPAYVSLKVL
jgi:FkbH-like protein